MKIKQLNKWLAERINLSKANTPHLSTQSILAPNNLSSRSVNKMDLHLEPWGTPCLKRTIVADTKVSVPLGLIRHS